MHLNLNPNIFIQFERVSSQMKLFTFLTLIAKRFQIFPKLQNGYYGILLVLME